MPTTNQIAKKRKIIEINTPIFDSILANHVAQSRDEKKGEKESE